MLPDPQRTRRLLPGVSRHLVASVLLTTGAAKLASPSSGAASILLGIVEVAAAGAIFAHRLVTLGMFIAGGIAIGGSLQALLSNAPCHCLGTMLLLGRKAHLTMSGVLGLLVALGLQTPTSQPTPTHQPKEHP